MNNDVGARLSLFQSRYTANVVHVRMGADDGLQFKAMLVNGCDNTFRIVTGIDADRSPRFLTAHDAGVLLKCGDSDFFDDHTKAVSRQ